MPINAVIFGLPLVGKLFTPLILVVLCAVLIMFIRTHLKSKNHKNDNSSIAEEMTKGDTDVPEKQNSISEEIKIEGEKANLDNNNENETVEKKKKKKKKGCCGTKGGCCKTKKDTGEKKESCGCGCSSKKKEKNELEESSSSTDSGHKSSSEDESETEHEILDVEDLGRMVQAIRTDLVPNNKTDNNNIRANRVPMGRVRIRNNLDIVKYRQPQLVA